MRPIIYLLLFITPIVFWAFLPQEQSEPDISPLIRAAEQGDIQQVRALLDEDELLDVRDPCAWTPLMKAAQNGHIEIARQLLARGAQVDAEDQGGYTALMLAASKGHLEMVKLLVEAGANIHHREHTRGWDAREWALREGQTAVADWLEMQQSTAQ